MTIWKEQDTFGDGDYRYMLSRINDDSKDIVNFIGLNPSTAYGINDDYTINQLKRMTLFQGWGGFIITNLYAKIDPASKAIKKEMDEDHDVTNFIGDDNNHHLAKWTKKTSMHIAIWGVRGKYKGRNEEVIKIIKNASGNKDIYCLDINRDGSPAHPLKRKKGLISPSTKLKIYR